MRGDLPADDGDVDDDQDFDEQLPWDLARKPRLIGADLDMGAFEGCRFDINGDDAIDGNDLTIVLGSWGSCPPPCPADLNHDFAVDGTDLTIILGAWGSCGGPSL